MRGLGRSQGRVFRLLRGLSGAVARLASRRVAVSALEACLGEVWAPAWRCVVVGRLSKGVLAPARRAPRSDVVTGGALPQTVDDSTETVMRSYRAPMWGFIVKTAGDRCRVSAGVSICV